MYLHYQILGLFSAFASSLSVCAIYTVKCKPRTKFRERITYANTFVFTCLYCSILLLERDAQKNPSFNNSTVEYGYLHQTDLSIKISRMDSMLAIVLLLRFYWYLHQTNFCIKFAGTKVEQISVFHCTTVRGRGQQESSFCVAVASSTGSLSLLISLGSQRAREEREREIPHFSSREKPDLNMMHGH